MHFICIHNIAIKIQYMYKKSTLSVNKINYSYSPASKEERKAHKLYIFWQYTYTYSDFERKELLFSKNINIRNPECNIALQYHRQWIVAVLVPAFWIYRIWHSKSVRHLQLCNVVLIFFIKSSIWKIKAFVNRSSIDLQLKMSQFTELMLPLLDFHWCQS